MATSTSSLSLLSSSSSSSRWLMVGVVLMIIIECVISSIVYDPIINNANGHLYRLVVTDAPLTFSEASRNATAYYINGNQGYLVTITDAAESQFLSTVSNTRLSNSSSAYPTYWTGSVRIGNLWYWQALGRQSAQFYDNTAGCLRYCNFATLPNTTDYYIKAYLYNSGGPAAGTWKPSPTNGTADAFLLEFDASSSCSSGYMLNSGTGWCTDVNECSTGNICGVGYTCENRVGSYFCNDVDECSKNATICPGGFYCQNTIGSYSCQDVNECALNSSLCSSGFQCNNTYGSYKCDDVNECLNASSCPFGSRCNNTVGSYNCDALWYFVTSQLSNLVMDINGTSPGSVVIVANKKTTNYNSQLWTFTPQGFIVNYLTGLVLDIARNDLSPGNDVIVWNQKPYEANLNQLWSYNATSQMVTSQAAPLVLDVNGGSLAPGTKIIVYTPKPIDNINQQYAFASVN